MHNNIQFLQSIFGVIFVFSINEGFLNTICWYIAPWQGLLTFSDCRIRILIIENFMIKCNIPIYSLLTIREQEDVNIVNFLITLLFSLKFKWKKINNKSFVQNETCINSKRDQAFIHALDRSIFYKKRTRKRGGPKLFWNNRTKTFSACNIQ